MLNTLCAYRTSSVILCFLDTSLRSGMYVSAAVIYDMFTAQLAVCLMHLHASMMPIACGNIAGGVSVALYISHQYGQTV